MNSTTLVACPAWCTADHRGDTATSYAHTTADTSGVIEATDPHTGGVEVICVDLEQTDADQRPVLVLHGTAMDLSLSLADAKRVYASLGERIASAERR